jgi:hypothetical protein
MKRILVTIAAAALLVPAGASAAIPPNATIQDDATPTAPGAYTPDTTPRLPGTYQTYDINITPGMTVGKFIVHIEWASLDDDWDMYVYRLDDPNVNPTTTEPPGTLVAASTGIGGTTTSETAIYAPSQPMPPGLYRVFVDNWAAADPPPGPNWIGTVTFQEFLPGNQRPAASLSGPDSANVGQSVTFDGSKSADSDGQIVNYSWDLDRDGLFETNGGTTPTLSRTFAAGTNIVGLRVIDNGGSAGYATKRLSVREGSSDRQDCLPDRASRRRAEVSRRGSFSLALLCPTSQSYRASVRIETARRVNLSQRRRLSRLLLGTARFNSKAGVRRNQVRVRLRRSGMRALRRLGSTRVVARVTLRLADGRTSTSAFRFFLAPPG